MESFQGVRRVRTGIVGLTLLLGACAIPEATVSVAPEATTTTTTVPAPPAPAAVTLPDISTRPLDLEVLGAMVPEGFATPSERSNGDLVTLAAFDTDDEAGDVIGFGRETGIAAAGALPAGPSWIWIDVLADADAAHRYLLDAVGDIVKRTGGTHTPAVGATTAAEFPVAVGEEAIGLTMALTDGSHATAVLFRLGRLVFFAGIGHGDGADLRVPVQYLAEDLAASAVTALTATPISPPGPAEPAHRFETTIRIEDGTGTSVAFAVAGIADGADLSCTIRRTAGDGATETTLTRVDGVLWGSFDDRPTQRVGGGNLAIPGLLALCPAWPLEADAAGLGSLRTGTTTRHHLNGVNATGYTPPPSALAEVVALPLDGVIVDSFSFWVADEAPWVVEIGFIATGSADAVAGLVPPDHGLTGQLRVTVRHRVLDLGTAGPVVPPDQSRRAELP